MILNFPDGFQPNENQVKILNAIEKAIANNEKFIVCNAPTGSGKSFIAPTLAKYANDPDSEWKSKVDDYSIFSEDGAEYSKNAAPFGVYALTITKALQDQYKETFDFAALLKGQGNYQCEYDPELTVDVAPCLRVSQGGGLGSALQETHPRGERSFVEITHRHREKVLAHHLVERDDWYHRWSTGRHVVSGAVSSGGSCGHVER